MRERLSELLKNSPHLDVLYHDDATYGQAADHLLANGVIVQKEGRWKGAGMGDYYCSLCCETYTGGNEYKYCPNCGAKMDGLAEREGKG